MRTLKEKTILPKLCEGLPWDRFVDSLQNSFGVCSVCSDKVILNKIHDIRRWRSDNTFQFYLNFWCGTCGEAEVKFIVNRERAKGEWKRRREEQQRELEERQARRRKDARKIVEQAQELVKSGLTVEQVYAEMMKGYYSENYFKRMCLDHIFKNIPCWALIPVVTEK